MVITGSERLCTSVVARSDQFSSVLIRRWRLEFHCHRLASVNPRPTTAILGVVRQWRYIGRVTWFPPHPAAGRLRACAQNTHTHTHTLL